MIEILNYLYLFNSMRYGTRIGAEEARIELISSSDDMILGSKKVKHCGIFRNLLFLY